MKEPYGSFIAQIENCALLARPFPDVLIERHPSQYFSETLERGRKLGQNRSVGRSVGAETENERSLGKNVRFFEPILPVAKHAVKKAGRGRLMGQTV